MKITKFVTRGFRRISLWLRVVVICRNWVEIPYFNLLLLLMVCFVQCLNT